MKGIDLAREYYLECAKNKLDTDFFDIKNKLAIGLVGSGSECYGYDDDISQDHDFEPGFCIFAPSDLDRKEMFQLERFYAQLPNEFKGFKRQLVSPVGEARKGLITTSEFYESKLGILYHDDSLINYFKVPEHYLLEATNGDIFEDNLGEFSKIRDKFKYLPEDVRLKKLAGNLLLMAQAGQYNYERCIKHGDTAASQLAVFEFVKACIASIFLLNRKYMPYYKWQFKALKNLPILSNIADSLEFLISTDNSKASFEGKLGMIEDISNMIIEELHNQDLTLCSCNNLENHAYSVNDKIKDTYIRTSNILMGV